VYLASTRALVAYADTEKAAPAAYGWVYWETANITYAGGYTSLTGGTAYWLVVTGDGASVLVAATDGHSSGDSAYVSADYTGGFADPIAAGTNSTKWPSIKCGVEPAAASGLSIPVAMAHYRRLREN